MSITELDKPNADGGVVNEADPAAVETFADVVFGHVLGAQAVQAIYLGQKLGWYQALAGAGPLTSVELAARTGTAERYAREWLEHQTVSGYLTVIDAGAAPTERQFSLPAAHAEVLANEDGLFFLAPLAQFIAGCGRHVDALLDAYRSGGGVSWAELGEDPREAQAAANRPLFLSALGDYFRAIPELDRALRDGGRVADVGCGGGWSSIGIAEAYPAAKVDGYDLDAPSISMARRNAAARALDHQVHFHHADAADVNEAAGSYEVVVAFECIHDMGDPVSVLASMRRLASDTGQVIVMDERVGEQFTGESDPVEQLMYGYSLVCCLPDGLHHEHSVGTGTVMRAPTLERYAQEAGFAGIEVLDIENDFFRFYRLTR